MAWEKLRAQRRTLLPAALLIVLWSLCGVSNAATLQIENIEVTQAIQCLDTSYGYANCANNSLDIVFGKPTVVRVYLSHDDPTPCPTNDPFVPLQGYKSEPVTLRWWVLKVGQDPTGMLPYQLTEYFDVPCSNNITDLRRSKRGSANFVIPADKLGVPSTTGGNVYLVEAEVRGNVQSLSRSILPPPQASLNVLWLMVDYQPAPYTPKYTGPSIGDPYAAAYAFPTIKTMYPMPVHYYSVLDPNSQSEAPATVKYTGPDIRTNGALSRGREIIDVVDAWKNQLEISPPPDVVIGWLPAGIGGGLGKSLVGGEAGMKSTFCIEFDEGTDAICLAHEVGHALGLQHPKDAVTGDVIDSCAPENATAGFGSGIGETGFDYFLTYRPCVGTVNSSASQFCPNGEATKIPYDMSVAYDGASGFMGAGAGKGDWISPYLWNRLLKKPDSPDWTNCPAKQTATRRGLMAPNLPAPTLAIVASGQISSGGATGSLGPLYLVQSAGPFSESDPAGAYCLDFLSGMSLLSSHCFNLSFQAPETLGPLSVDFFNRKMPFPSGTERIVLRAGTNALDQRAQTINPPDLLITSPAGGGSISGVMNIAWTASDLDGDALTYSVLYSRDGTSFVPLAVNIPSSSLSVDTATLAGGVSSFIRVLATDGFNTTATDSGIFAITKKPPRVFISAPQDQALISSADDLVLIGAAQDIQDGEITTPSSFSWHRDGAILLGSGPELILAPGTLGSGTHVISLDVRNSAGQMTTASISLSVTQPPVAVCKNPTVSADAQCKASASIENGSYDPEGDPITITQKPAGPFDLGATSVGLTVVDQLGISDRCLGVVTVQDTTAPLVSCNAPATMLTSASPVSFTSSANDACSGARATSISGFSCYAFYKGKRVDKSSSCVVQIQGDTINILDTGGVGDNIDWTVTSTDASSNTATKTCHLLVVKK